MTPELLAAAADVQAQRERDELAPNSKEARYPAPAVLQARIVAAIQAWRHRHEEPHAARQALIELAAVAAAIASRLPQPEHHR